MTKNKQTQTTAAKNLLPVGIDPSRDSLGVAMLHPDRDEVLAAMNIANQSHQDAQKLVDEAWKLAERLNTEPVFVIEATNVFWRPLASWLKAGEQQVHIVSSRQTHANRSSGTRKTKTDAIDAAIIARLYQQKKSSAVYLPEEPYMSLRELSRTNAFLADLRARLSGRVYTILYQIHPVWKDCFAHPFTKTSLELMSREWVHPEKLAQVSAEELAEVTSRTSGGKQGLVFAQGLKAATARVFHVEEGAEGFSLELKCLSEMIASINKVSEELRLRMAGLLKSLPAELIETIPGMSTVTTASFLGELGDWKRFPSADKAVAWFGYDPRLEQSGLDSGEGRKLSKAGTRYGRRTMYLAALPFIKTVPQAKKKFKALVRSGRAKREAVCLMAADLIKTCYAMLRDNAPFDPKKV